MHALFSDLGANLRFATRSLKNNPGFTAVAVLTLALGIGANSAILSVIYPVLMRPLPYPSPDELVWVTTEIPQFRAEMTPGADYLDWRDHAQSLDAIAAQSVTPVTLETGQSPERLRAGRVTSAMLPMLGAIPEQGRLLHVEDERLPGAPVAVASSSLWNRQFGETALDGQRLELDGRSYEVVGVLPEGFRYPGEVEPDVYLPLVLDEARERGRHQMEVVETIARLAPGVSPEQARAELQTIHDRARESAFPPSEPSGESPRDEPQAQTPAPREGEPRELRLQLQPGQSIDEALKAAGMSEEEIARIKQGLEQGGGHRAEIRTEAGREAPGASPGQAPTPPAPQGPVRRGGGGGGRIEMRVERSGDGVEGGGGAGGGARPSLPESFVRVVPLHERLVGDLRPALLILFGAVGLVLLVACANVAHLLLARAASRQREMAVRTALGASRARVTGQLLTESVLLATLGGLAGLALAAGGVRLLLGFLPADLGGGLIQRLDVGLDLPVLAFTLLLALATGVLFGLAPVWLTARSGVGEALKEASAQTSAGRRRGRLNRALVAVEVALSVVLLVGAGLLLRSFLTLTSVDPGFSPERVLTSAINIDPDHQGGLDAPENREKWAAFYRELLPRLERLPGVESAAIGDVVPLTGFRRLAMGLRVEGIEPPTLEQPPQVAMTAVTPDYFRTLGIDVVDGRPFQAGDRLGAEPVGIVNEALVSQLFAGQEPVGRRIRLRPDRPPVTVVGVVADVQQEGLDQPAKGQLYLPLEQEPLPFSFAALRTSVDPGSLTQTVERAIHDLDPRIPVTNVMTLEDRLSTSVAQPRFQALLLGLFALLALVLAAVGLYGVMVYLVTERRRELGVRMALGADRPGLVRMVLAQAFGMAAVGIVLGLVAAAGLSRLLEGRLFGIQPLDPVTFVGIPLLLLTVVLLASLVPARRAVTVDPAQVLREE